MIKNKEDITVLCKAGAFVCRIVHTRRRVYQAKTPLISGLKEYVWAGKKKEPVIRDPKTGNAFIQHQLTIEQW